jgi:hypothetical protein
VDIRTESSVKHDDELANKAVTRRSLGTARLHSATEESAPPPNLVCLDPDRVEDLRARVSSFSNDDARTAIPVRALFDSIMQTSMTLSLPAPSRVGAQPREGRCVSGTTLGALEYLLQSAVRPDPRQRSLLRVPFRRPTSLAPESTHQLDAASGAGNTASGRKPLLSGVYDLLAPFCPLYPAC